MKLFVGKETLKLQKGRLIILALTAVACALILIAKLLSVQVKSGSYYYRLSENNFIKVRRIEAKRGRILDRNGVELATNMPSYSVGVTPAFADDPDALTLKLASFLNLDPKETLALKRALSVKGLERFREYVVRPSVDRNQLALLLSRQDELKGVALRRSYERFYPIGELFVHPVGYVGPPSEADLQTPGIFPDIPVGKSGLERSYQHLLRGRDGEKRVIVDSRGVEAQNVELAEFIKNSEIPAEPGYDVFTSLDSRLQKKADEVFDSLGFNSGAVWAMEVKTGQILVAYSKPAFDPNLFVRGIPSSVWNRLRDDVLNPLMDKGIQGAFFPGSTIKPFMAYIALSEHVYSTGERVGCGGYKSLGDHKFRCWNKHGHGAVNIYRAIKESCDIFFYEMGGRLGLEKMSSNAFLFGLNEQTGVDLPNESKGVYPSLEWHKKVHNRPWNLGDSYNSAIGQGDVKVTPAQLLVMYAALLNGGYVYMPQLFLKAETRDGEIVEKSHPKLKRKIDLDPAFAEIVKTGLSMVVNEQGGTGYSKCRSDKIKIGGKTGTAQVKSMAQDGEQKSKEEAKYWEKDHALFVGFAPIDNPEIVVAAIAEHGEHGASVSPVVKAIIEEWHALKIKDGAESKVLK